MERRTVLLPLVLVVFLLSLACNFPTGSPSPTGTPVETEQPTLEPAATDTLVPAATATDEPAATAVPTATARPTYTPKPTNTPAPTPTVRPSATVKPAAPALPPVPTALAPAIATVLATVPVGTLPDEASVEVVALTIAATRRAMEEFGGMIDVALGQGWVDCEEVVMRFDVLAAAPTLPVAAGDVAAVEGHALYRQAIEVFVAGAKDMTQNCRDFLTDENSGSIPFQQWGLARLRVNEAVALLNAGWSRVQ